MPLTNTHSHYGTVSKLFHWTIAALIFTVIPLGLIAESLPLDTSASAARKAMLFSAHKTVGVAIFFLALARILWALINPHPVLLNSERNVEAFAARVAHWLLYGSLVLVPLFGWIHHAATTGFAPIWWPFGQSLPFVPQSAYVAKVFSALHMIFERVMVFTILAHVAGALKHHLFDKDATLRRMLPGKPEVDVAPPAKPAKARWPLLGALTVWGCALVIGAVLGLFPARTNEAISEAALPEVQSQWQVTEGEIAIEISQLGSKVSGSFNDWTARITYDDTPLITTEKRGDVDVSIAIASLQLGSVAEQAQEPDYFDSTTFPTARFVGEIIEIIDGNELVGTLTIKGTSHEVAFPVTIKTENGEATASGWVELDRRTFGIGTSMEDESTLGYSVIVRITLEAKRAAQ